MQHWTVRQIFALVLGALIALGLNLSAVQASDMSMKMAMASAMAGSGHGDCHGCADKPDAGAKTMTCVSTCVAPLLAVLPQGLPSTVHVVSTLSPVPSPFLPGRIASPEPFPPRPSDHV